MFAIELNALYRVIPTKWQSYHDHRLCDVTSPTVRLFTCGTDARCYPIFHADLQGEKKISTRSSNLDDSGDVRSSRLGPEVSDAVRDAEDMSGDTCPPIQVAQHLSQPVVDYRSWPHLDVTVATRLQHSSTMELGILLITQEVILYTA